MASHRKSSSFEILEYTEKLEKELSGITAMSLTQAGNFLGKNPSVLAQYAKANIIHPIQQGPRKLLRMDEIYLMQALFYLAERYNCSYVTCRLIKAFLEELNIHPVQYLDFVKKMENRAQIKEKEVLKHVNSYKNRGIFQKQKNKKSAESVQ